MSEPLITKYRPTTFSEMIGHTEVLGGLQKALAGENRPHAFLLTGPSGVGKTTVARVVANHLHAEILEVDAAAHNGVDSVRELIDLGQYQSLNGNPSRMFILNEAHMFSRSSWNALLMTLEEPPDHLNIAITTTEVAKVPDAVVTRCYPVALRALKDLDLVDLVELVCDMEDWKTDPDILSMVIHASTGQPRKALNILQAVHDAPSLAEAQRIVALQGENRTLITLLNLLLNGQRSWEAAQPLLMQVIAEEDDFDGAMTLAGRYVAAAMAKEKTEKQAQQIGSLLESLTYPAGSYDKQTVFVTAISRYLWGDSR
jgi:DNA polymerase III subunit gamma/tau